MARVNQQELARRLGIAQITVSKALRGDSDIAQETRRKVKELAEKLGYMPNLLARSLVEGRTKAIGIFLPKLGGKYYSILLETLEERIRKQGYTPLLAVAGNSEDEDNRSIMGLLQYRVAGMVVCIGHACWRPSVVDVARNSKNPLVFIGKSEIPNVCRVYSRDDESIMAAVDYLREHGHREIFLVSFAHDRNPVIESREKAFLAALKNGGMEDGKERVVRAHWDQVRSAVTEHVRQTPSLSAYLCISDELALQAIKGVEDAGRQVPGDVSVMGHGDNIEYQEHMKTPLTTMAHDPRAIGIRAVDLLECQMENRAIKGHFTFENRIIVRNSVKDLRG